MALPLDVPELSTSITAPLIIPAASDATLERTSSLGALLGQLFLESLYLFCQFRHRLLQLFHGSVCLLLERTNFWVCYSSILKEVTCL